MRKNTTVTRTTRVNNSALKKENAALRAELEELKAAVALHEECLETAAEAIKTLQDKILKASACESPKKPVKKAAAPKEQGRPWNKLNKDEKHKLNAYAYRHPEDFGGWEGWCEKRLTLMFR